MFRIDLGGNGSNLPAVNALTIPQTGRAEAMMCKWSLAALYLRMIVDMYEAKFETGGPF